MPRQAKHSPRGVVTLDGELHIKAYPAGTVDATPRTSLPHFCSNAGQSVYGNSTLLSLACSVIGPVPGACRDIAPPGQLTILLGDRVQVSHGCDVQHAVRCRCG